MKLTQLDSLYDMTYLPSLVIDLSCLQDISNPTVNAKCNQTTHNYTSKDLVTLGRKTIIYYSTISIVQYPGEYMNLEAKADHPSIQYSGQSPQGRYLHSGFTLTHLFTERSVGISSLVLMSPG